MTEFKIGDRVKCISQYKINEVKVFNKVGTVKNLHNDFSYSVGVEFDDKVQGHTCDNSCKEGHGLWLSPKMLKKIGSTDKIIIYAKGETVTAKLIRNKKCVAQTVAKCSPNDDFDVLVGAQIILQKLAEDQNSKYVINTKAFKNLKNTEII